MTGPTRLALLAALTALTVAAPASGSAAPGHCADIVHYHGWGAAHFELHHIGCHDAHTVARRAILAAPHLDDTPSAIKRVTLEVPGLGRLRCNVHGVDRFTHECHATIDHVNVRVGFVLVRGGTRSTFTGPEL